MTSHNELPTSQTLLDVFLASCRDYAKQPAIQCLGSRLTYRQLYRRCCQFAGYCQSEGVQAGDRIALMLPNLPQYVTALYGSFMCGATVVNLNPLFKAQELTNYLTDSWPQVIVVLASTTPELAKALDNMPDYHPQVIVTQIGDMIGPFYKRWLINYKKGIQPSQLPQAKVVEWRVCLQKGRQFSWQKPKVSPDDLAFLQYTGGTTGEPKAAMLTHSNIRANVEQAFQWISPPCQAGKETLLAVLPLFHIFSLVANALVALRGGAVMILVPDARDIEGVVRLLKKYPISVLMGINTLFEALVKHPTFNQLKLSSLKLVIGGGMAVHEHVAHKWQNITHVPIHQGYGLTEASPIVCINPIHLKQFNNSIGLPVSHTRVKVVDENDHELGRNTVGELCVQGPQVMQGYWQRPQDTADTLRNGWLHTGDMARIDDQGFVYIVDRKKDMVIVSGYNVYPQELEQLLVQHDSIEEAAVVGEYHAKLGEALKAFVVTQSDQLTKAEVISYCRQHLVSYKVPRRVEFIDALPKSNVGKVLKKQLKNNKSKQ